MSTTMVYCRGCGSELLDNPAVCPKCTAPQVYESLACQPPSYDHGFIGSVKTCFRKYAVFRDRAPRSEFWWWTLFYFGTAFISGFLIAAYEQSTGDLSVKQPMLELLSLVMFLPTLAVSVRRLHDIGKSGWWMLLTIVPVAVMGGLQEDSHQLLQQSDVATQNLGNSLETIVGFIALIWVAMCILMIVWFSQPSSPGANRFGANPNNA